MKKYFDFILSHIWFSIKLYILVIILFPANINISNCTDIGFYLNPIAGISISKNSCGTVGFETGLIINKFTFSLDYYESKEIRINLNNMFYSIQPEEYYNQIGLNFGTYFDGNRMIRNYLHVGISNMKGVIRTGFIKKESKFLSQTDYYDSNKFSIIGLAAKFDVHIFLCDYISFGFGFQANINAENTTLLLMIGLKMGKLKFGQRVVH